MAPKTLAIRVRNHFIALARACRVDLLYSVSGGFDAGVFAWKWLRLGPLMLYREMLCCEGSPPPLGPWRLGIFLSSAALHGFYEGVSK